MIDKANGPASGLVIGLAELLAVPYILETSSVLAAGGRWVRRAEFIELAGCVAESESIVEAIDAADRLRVRILLDLWVSGAALDPPRPPLGPYDLDAELERLGLRAEYAAALTMRRR